MNPLAALRLAWMRARLRDRCLLGKGAVVYEPARVLSWRREAISIGARTHVRGELFTFPGGTLTIGEDCYVGEQTRIWSRQSIAIGNRVLIAHLTTIVDNTTHPLEAEARHLHYRTIVTKGHPLQEGLSPEPVRIEDDAWIASHVVILRGVTVGRGAVVAAGSVVTENVEANTMVAGNPARLIRRLSAGG